MKVMIGNMFNKSPDLLCVTTNSVVKDNDELVMGAGAAREMKKRFPQIAKIAGLRVLSACGSYGAYGLIVIGGLGLFQVKYDWKDSANLELIRKSTSMLHSWAIKNPDRSISLNYPGIGLGGLNERNVFPIISRLPDNVTVWKLN